MPEPQIEIVEYENDAGDNSFGDWMASLGDDAYAKVFTAVTRLKDGNFGDVKPVGEGVCERRIHWGPGLRIYFGKDGQKLVILLGGGTKRRQANDIKTAKGNWEEYKKNRRRNKKNGTN